ncbi:hypothetical protein QAD02_004558, partial [Eretmocerus hayati]
MNEFVVFLLICVSSAVATSTTSPRPPCPHHRHPETIEEVREKIREWQLYVDKVCHDTIQMMRDWFVDVPYLEFVEPGPSCAQTGSGAGAHSATVGHRKLAHNDECVAGPSSGPSNAQATQSTSKSAGSPSRSELERELYEIARDLKEMREEMGLSWPAQSDPVSPSPDDEFSPLDRNRINLRLFRDFVQLQLSILNHETERELERLTIGRSEYQEAARQHQEELEGVVQHFEEVTDKYETFVKNFEIRIKQMDSDPSNSKCEKPKSREAKE